jgi:hypothetical protein
MSKELFEVLPAKELIRIIKSINFKSFNADDIKKVEYETETYNPFDKDFEGRIYLYPAIIDIDKNKEGGYLIRVGKNNGWIGGLTFKDTEYSFIIKSLNVNELENGLKKAANV